MSECAHEGEVRASMTFTSGDWIITYHEHRGAQCAQETQPSEGCPNPAVVLGWDCQATSDGWFACTHIVDPNRTPPQADAEEPVEAEEAEEAAATRGMDDVKDNPEGAFAWHINGLLLEIRERRLGIAGRNKVHPVKDKTHRQAVIDAGERAAVNAEWAFGELKKLPEFE